VTDVFAGHSDADPRTLSTQGLIWARCGQSPRFRQLSKNLYRFQGMLAHGSRFLSAGDMAGGFHLSFVGL
jgi:hypothetical protein